MALKSELEAESLKPMSQEEALRFVARLANTDIDELKKTPDNPEGLLSILYNLRRYLDVVGGEAELKRALDRAANHPDDLKKPISDLKGLLNAVVEGRLKQTRVTLTKQRTTEFMQIRGELLAVQDGDLRESLIDAAFGDLDQTKIKLLRLGRCTRDTCDKLFYKVKMNQHYCDHQCANRAAAERRAARINSRSPKGKAGSQQRPQS